MQVTTVVLLFLAVIISFAIAWFQYFFKKKGNRINLTLGILRFLMIFSLLILLINPKFIQNSYFIEKADLVLAVDNSSSIRSFDADSIAKKTFKEIAENTAILERFDISSYSFGEKLKVLDSLTFNEPITDVARALNTLNGVNDENEQAVVLWSDGNQTLGADYEFQRLNKGLHIYPVVLGDTTAYKDIKVGQLNCNNYAFLGNKYPLEVNINYSGNGSVRTNARILVNSKEVYREQIILDSQKNSIFLKTLLEAKSVGVKRVTVRVDPFENEKNIKNNSKSAIVEVIDEKTNVAIVSSIKHPDIGMLKKSIETNQQRAVTIITPNAVESQLEETDLFILYQPNRNFQKAYDVIKNKGGSLFTITGPKTDWRFLNQVQASFSKEMFNQSEDVVPLKNKAFDLFDIGDLSFEGYPPLNTSLGELSVAQPYEAIAFQKVKGVVLNQPLFLLIKDEETKEAILFGEGIWKWRMQSYRNNSNFEAFDNFIGKLIRYLSDSKQKSRLELDYETIYGGIESTTLSARYFDETYVFDSSVNLTLKLTKVETSFSTERPLLLSGESYKVDLDDLEAGDYNFIVTTNKDNISKSGRFTILDFDLESQFLSSDNDKLERLANKTNGKLFYTSQINLLVQSLLSNPQYTPTQKSTKNVVSLIDFRWLLAIIAFTLAFEWFIRKYNGLL